MYIHRAAYKPLRGTAGRLCAVVSPGLPGVAPRMRTIKKLLDLLTPSERKCAYLLLGMTLVMATIVTDVPARKIKDIVD